MTFQLRRRGAFVSLGIASVLLCSACGGGDDDAGGGSGGDSTPVAGADGECTMDSLYEAAQEEGTLVRWGGQDPEDMAVVYEAFSAEYPGIEIQDAVVNPDETPTRLLTERSAGNAPPDLFQGRVSFLKPLVDAGALNQDPGWADCGARDEIIQADGGLTENVQPWALAYNTDEMSPDDLPTSWEDLADAQYQGMMSVDPRGFPFDMLALSLGGDGAVDLVTSLKETVDPVLTQGGTAGLAEVASGEIAIRPALVPDIKASQADGAPVDFVYLDPVLVLNDAIYMPEGVEHPNAAMLFALWYAAEDGGQAITRERNFRDNSQPSDIPDGVEMLAAETAEDAGEVVTANQEIVGIWGG